MNHKFTIIACFLLSLALPLRILAQEWVVPEDQKGRTSPFKFTPETVKAGEAVYLKNCKSCHGDPGKKNWAPIKPEPGDPASEKYQSQLDGEMFYRVTTGKAPMPQFGNILSEEERWQVISFIRSFNPNYVQPPLEKKTAFTGRNVRLKLYYDQEIKNPVVEAVEITKEKQIIPAKGVPVQLFVKRYFGNMQVDEIKTTNEKGKAMFKFPADLPGDKAGKVILTAMVHDESGKMTQARAMDTVAIGVPTDRPSLIATRAWWTVRSQAPIWVILTYSLAVIVAWGFIIYILYMVGKIRKI